MLYTSQERVLSQRKGERGKEKVIRCSATNYNAMVLTWQNLALQLSRDVRERERERERQVIPSLIIQLWCRNLRCTTQMQQFFCVIFTSRERAGKKGGRASE